MAQRSLPWEGITTGDAGAYSDADWQALQRSVISLAGFPNAGIVIGSANGSAELVGLDVTADSPASADVIVSPGGALVDGVAYMNDADVTFTIAANSSGNPRIDLIVLRRDATAQTVRLALLQGTPAASPGLPTLTHNSSIYEVPVAEIAVANGFTTITQSNITPIFTPANAAPGDYLFGILNNSGARLRTGDVVIWDTSLNSAVTVTTTANHALVAGVWIGTTDDDEVGMLQVGGVGWVRTNGAVARGTTLSTSTTARQAKAGGAHPAAFTLEATSGSALVRAVIGAHPVQGFYQQIKRFTTDYTVATAAYPPAFANVDATNLSISAETHGGNLEVWFSGQVGDASVTDTSAVFDVTLDGTRIWGGRNGGFQVVLLNGIETFGNRITVENVAAGAHTIRLQWAGSPAGQTLTLRSMVSGNNDMPIILGVREVWE